LGYGTEKLLAIEGLKIIGTAKNKSSVISFLINDIHPYDLGVLLNEQGIAIRTGHHCCQPLMERLEIEGTCRASFAFYNTIEEIDMLAHGIQKAVRLLG
jgi:cysteine desulfurase/selenocysteine lyase